MNLRSTSALTSLLMFAVFTATAACSAPKGVDDDDANSSEDGVKATVTPAERAAATRTSLKGFTFDHLTPTGTELFKASVYWRSHQIEDLRYPIKRMCASNVSKVLFLGGIKEFNEEGVRALIHSIEQKEGSKVVRMPLASTTEKRAFIDQLNALDHGKIPTGTLVAGCLTPDCDSRPGDQHVGIVGNVDPDGTVWVWHNNWYRPENEGGAWKPYMIYTENRKLYEVQGLERQWMATPWLRVKRNAAGLIVAADSIVPKIDDLDPLGGKYYMTLALVPELVADLQAGR